MNDRSLKDAALNDIAKLPGLSVESVINSRSHVKIRVVTPSGIKLLVVSVTPGDWRAALNNRALLRRWAREGA